MCRKMSNLNPEPDEPDPAKILQQLEIELALRRAERQQTRSRYGNLRALSFGFLFLIVFGSFLAFFFFMNSEQMQQIRAGAAERANASPSPTETPR